MQKSLTRIIGEGSAWTMANTVIVKVIGLVTIYITLQTLSVYEYGVAELAITAVSFFSIFLLPGLSSVVVADMGVEKGKGNLAGAKGLYWSFLRLQSLMAGLAFLVLFFGADVIGSFYPEHIVQYFRILAFTYPLSVVGMAYSITFTLTFRYFEQSLNSFFQELFKLGIMIIALFYFGLKVEAILYGMVFSQALTFLVQYPRFRRAYRELGEVKPSHASMWKTLYEHGKWSIFSTYLGTFSSNLRTWLIKLFFGTEAVALFAVASGLVGHTASLVPISNVVSPIIAQFINDTERFKRLISKTIKYQFIGYSTVIIAAIILFPPIITWLFPKYIAAMPLYRVMVFSLIPTGIASVYIAVFFALKAQRNLFFSMIVKTIALAVTIPLFANFGTIGAAYSFVAVSVLYTLERYRIMRKLVPGFRLNLGHAFSVDDLDRIIIGKLRAAIQRAIHF